MTVLVQLTQITRSPPLSNLKSRWHYILNISNRLKGVECILPGRPVPLDHPSHLSEHRGNPISVWPRFRPHHLCLHECVTVAHIYR